MNIEEYRAMKAEQERAKTDAQTQRTDAEPNEAEQAKDEPVQQAPEQTNLPNGNGEVDDTSKETVVEPPQTIEIDGKELTIEELKNGYLRQSDYTKKTQEARRKEQEAERALKLLEQLQADPKLAEQLSQQFNDPYLDPSQAKVKDLEDKYFDLYIQTEMRNLHDKYGEFNDDDVLNIAMNERIENLDTAYQVMKSRKGGGEDNKTQPSLDEIKAQLREELMQELRAQQDAQVDTSTVIQTGGDTSPVRDTTPQLSQQEMKVAKMMGMNSEEYAKWRDISKKNK